MNKEATWMKFSHTVGIDVPTAAIDLGDWIFGMSDEEYQQCAKGHRAMGVLGDAARSGMINVESIGGSLLIQHYKTQFLHDDHVSFVSSKSRAYLMHLVPMRVWVGWEMQVSPVAEGRSDFRCTIEVVLPLVVRVLGPLTGANHFIKQHLIEETESFADHVTKRFTATKLAGVPVRLDAARAA